MDSKKAVSEAPSTSASAAYMKTHFRRVKGGAAGAQKEQVSGSSSSAVMASTSAATLNQKAGSLLFGSSLLAASSANAAAAQTAATARPGGAPETSTNVTSQTRPTSASMMTASGGMHPSQPADISSSVTALGQQRPVHNWRAKKAAGGIRSQADDRMQERLQDPSSLTTDCSYVSDYEGSVAGSVAGSEKYGPTAGTAAYMMRESEGRRSRRAVIFPTSRSTQTTGSKHASFIHEGVPFTDSQGARDLSLMSGQHHNAHEPSAAAVPFTTRPKTGSSMQLTPGSPAGSLHQSNTASAASTPARHVAFTGAAGQRNVLPAAATAAAASRQPPHAMTSGIVGHERRNAAASHTSNGRSVGAVSDQEDHVEFYISDKEQLTRPRKMSGDHTGIRIDDMVTAQRPLQERRQELRSKFQQYHKTNKTTARTQAGGGDAAHGAFPASLSSNSPAAVAGGSVSDGSPLAQHFAAAHSFLNWLPFHHHASTTALAEQASSPRPSVRSEAGTRKPRARQEAADLIRPQSAATRLARIASLPVTPQPRGPHGSGTTSRLVTDIIEMPGMRAEGMMTEPQQQRLLAGPAILKQSDASGNAKSARIVSADAAQSIAANPQGGAEGGGGAWYGAEDDFLQEVEDSVPLYQHGRKAMQQSQPVASENTAGTAGSSYAAISPEEVNRQAEVRPESPKGASASGHRLTEQAAAPAQAPVGSVGTTVRRHNSWDDDDNDDDENKCYKPDFNYDHHDYNNDDYSRPSTPDSGGNWDDSPGRGHDYDAVYHYHGSRPSTPDSGGCISPSARQSMMQPADSQQLLPAMNTEQSQLAQISDAAAARKGDVESTRKRKSKRGGGRRLLDGGLSSAAVPASAAALARARLERRGTATPEWGSSASGLSGSGGSGGSGGGSGNYRLDGPSLMPSRFGSLEGSRKGQDSLMTKLQLYEMHNMMKAVHSDRHQVADIFMEKLMEGEESVHGGSGHLKLSEQRSFGFAGQANSQNNAGDNKVLDAAHQNMQTAAADGQADLATIVRTGALGGILSHADSMAKGSEVEPTAEKNRQVTFEGRCLPGRDGDEFNDRDGVPAAEGKWEEEDDGGELEGENGLTEKELAELDKEVIQEIYDRVEKAEAQITSYKHLLTFLLFVTLYVIVIFLQVNSSSSYKITSAHQTLLPPGMDQSSSYHFDNKNQFYSWINNSVIQVVWQDPVCGDGVCQRPLELSALSDRQGCAADCGYFPNVTQVFVFLSTNFESQEAQEAASWNLCSLRPVAFCWFPSLQRFSQLAANNMFEFSLIDGDWVLILNAPRGGVKGSVEKTVGSVKESTLGVETKKSLVSWGSCTADPAISKRAGCRQTCAMLILCMRSVCHGVMDMPTFSSVYVDCLDGCQLDPSRFGPFFGETCNAKVFGQVQKVFPNVHCHPVQPPPPPNPPAILSTGSAKVAQAHHALLHPPLPSSSLESSKEGRGLQVKLQPSPPVPKASANATVINSTGGPQLFVPQAKMFSPKVGDFTLWELLGPADIQRVTKLKVAVNRLIFTMVQHECLASVVQSVSFGMRKHLAAVLCTLLGGPVTMEECKLIDPATKQQLTALPDIYEYLNTRHRRLHISSAHYEAFIDLAVMAVESVTVLDSAAAAALYRILSALRDAIVDPSIPGCPQGLVIKIKGGASYNTTVETGSIITWEWDDNLPHSIKLSGMGEEFPYFQGFGGSHYLVSRNDICTPLNIGPDDAIADPAPCVLRHPGSPVAPFRYTRIFNLEGTVFYEGTQFGDDVTGRIDAIRKRNSSNSVELSFECAPACQLSMVGNGRCDAACNTAGCAFDGGDCACSSSRTGNRDSCGCGEGQKMGDDGACCELDSVGSNLQFPFSLRTFGENIDESNAEFVGSQKSSLERFVSGRNRVLIGMILTQSRWSSARCSGSKFSSLSGSCTGHSELTRFGKNPYFLPGSTLYDPAVAKGQSSLIFNHTATHMEDLARGPDGFPYGFFPVKFAKDSAPLVFDINLSQAQALKRLQYLQSGFYIDNHTEQIEVAFLTYNGDEHLFVLTHVICKVETSGEMVVSQTILPISFEKYYPSFENVVRMLLEIVYVISLFWNLWEEVRQMMSDGRKYGAYTAYFASIWNWIDIISILIQLVCVGLWLTTAVIQSSLFSVEPRYDLYASLSETPFPWALSSETGEFENALSVFHQIEYSIQLQGIYFSLQGINVFLYMMRILKLMDFQPHIGIFTRTLKAAGNGLFHFFLLWGIVFLGYATFGCLAFGRFLEPFRTMLSSMTTCFLMVLGDTSVAYSFQQLKGWEYIAAMIFWVSFITIIVFILFNFLIAIIVDAFMDVKDVANEHPSLLSDVYSISQKLMLRIATPYSKYNKMRRHLHVLGGNHKLTEEEMSFLSLYRRLSGGHGLMKDTCFGFKKPTSPKDKEERIFRIMDMAIDKASLSVILERAQAREEHNGGVVASLKPDALGTAVLWQFGEMARLEDIEEAPFLPPQKRPKKEIAVLQESLLDLKQEMRDSILQMRHMILLDEEKAREDEMIREYSEYEEEVPPFSDVYRGQ